MDHENRKKVDDFLAAKARVRKVLAGETVEENSLVASSDLALLLEGIPPDPELPKSRCSFDARFVPFLRCVQPDSSNSLGGITVLPHPDGGVMLSTTDGCVMLLARDPFGYVSEGGCRLLMPVGALDACKAPKPFSLDDQGDDFEIAPPDYSVPDKVISLGASLLVWPKAQPPERADPDCRTV